MDDLRYKNQENDLAGSSRKTTLHAHRRTILAGKRPIFALASFAAARKSCRRQINKAIGRLVGLKGKWERENTASAGRLNVGAFKFISEWSGICRERIKDRKLELESFAVVKLIWEGKIIAGVYPVDL